MGLILITVFSSLAFVIYRIQQKIDATFGEYRSTEEILYVENGKLLKKVLLGYESLAADIYWLRTVQYFGGKRLYDPEKRFDLLEPLLEITTDLDPHLKIAYRYGAIFLSEPWPRGAGLPIKGIALADKGIANNPEYWRFYLDKGFIYFWHLQDYRRAAEIFLEGGEVPGAPYWMAGTAARAATRGGDRETARLLWKAMAETAENEQVLENAITHLQQLDALDVIDQLTPVVHAFEQQTGRFPNSWNELVEAGLLPGIPVDPTGEAFVLNPRDKTVEISEASFLAGLPTR
jgi:hypothetical protein